MSLLLNISVAFNLVTACNVVSFRDHLSADTKMGPRSSALKSSDRIYFSCLMSQKCRSSWIKKIQKIWNQCYNLGKEEEDGKWLLFSLHLISDAESAVTAFPPFILVGPKPLHIWDRPRGDSLTRRIGKVS